MDGLSQPAEATYRYSGRVSQAFVTDAGEKVLPSSVKVRVLKEIPAETPAEMPTEKISAE